MLALDVRDPVAVVLRVQPAGDQQDDVDEPPDSHAAEGEELPDCGARLAQAEAVQPQEAQQDRVEQRRQEVVVGISAVSATMLGKSTIIMFQDE